ncbi:MAG: FKBP-type peptidyl-prolyl cis-trans isomerase [bacterium]|nr:FKBP-type peptidyl-prolyl cis-trans isomerase [bacterium]
MNTRLPTILIVACTTLTTCLAHAAENASTFANTVADMTIVRNESYAPQRDQSHTPLPSTLSQPQRFSYIYGFNAGANLKELGFEVDEAMYLRGFRDGLADPTNAALSADTIRATLEELNKYVAQKQKEREEKWLAESKQRGEQNKKEGEAFLKENKRKPGVITTRSGLQYVVLRQGDGPKPRLRDTVKVVYSGRLLDGTEFANTEKLAKPVELPLSRALDGWKEGLMLMPVGSKYRFFIPSELAYGPHGQPGTPIYPYAVLVFDIELLGIIP